MSASVACLLWICHLVNFGPCVMMYHINFGKCDGNSRLTAVFWRSTPTTMYQWFPRRLRATSSSFNGSQLDMYCRHSASNSSKTVLPEGINSSIHLGRSDRKAKPNPDLSFIQVGTLYLCFSWLTHERQKELPVKRNPLKF